MTGLIRYSTITHLTYIICLPQLYGGHTAMVPVPAERNILDPGYLYPKNSLLSFTICARKVNKLTFGRSTISTADDFDLGTARIELACSHCLALIQCDYLMPYHIFSIVNTFRHSDVSSLLLIIQFLRRLIILKSKLISHKPHILLISRE